LGEVKRESVRARDAKTSQEKDYPCIRGGETVTDNKKKANQRGEIGRFESERVNRALSQKKEKRRCGKGGWTRGRECSKEVTENPLIFKGPDCEVVPLPGKKGKDSGKPLTEDLVDL